MKIIQHKSLRIGRSNGQLKILNEFESKNGKEKLVLTESTEYNSIFKEATDVDERYYILKGKATTPLEQMAAFPFYRLLKRTDGTVQFIRHDAHTVHGAFMRLTIKEGNKLDFEIEETK